MLPQGRRRANSVGSHQVLVQRGIARYRRRMAMTLRLDDELDAALEETARREHRSKQEVVRVAIQQYTSRRSALREEALARIVSEDAELLRRLGE
jgi:predicted transcriptional regulator